MVRVFVIRMKLLEANEFLRKFRNSLGTKKKLARFIIFMITHRKHIHPIYLSTVKYFE